MYSNCQFCLQNNVIEGDILYEDDLWYYVTSIDPVLSVGGMLITKRHITQPFEISEDEWNALRPLLAKIKTIIDKEAVHGYNIGWNINPAAGQNVEHAHLHFFGRYEDEPLAYKGLRYAFKQEANKRPGSIV